MTAKITNILKKNNINENDIIAFYKNHSLAQTAQNFNISQFVVNKVLDTSNIQKHTRQENTEFTNIAKYGCKNIFQVDAIKQQIKDNNLKNYGVEYNCQRNDVKDSIKQHCLDKYGVEYTSQIPESRIKAKETIINKFGYDNYNNRQQYKQTMLDRYGKVAPLQIQQFKDKAVEKCLEKYGVPYNCMRDEARMHGNNSKPNQEFAELLESYGLEKATISMDNNHYSREFNLETYSYDFKINNTLIEINPTITHNILYVPFSREPLDKNYHKNKSLFAIKNNYRCIHIFDWEDREKIINLIKHNEKVYARLCNIKLLDVETAYTFINANHIQNYAKDSIRLGIYYNNELISVMTFGKPRYNKNYEYELIRYCSSKNIIGGAEKLFKYFIKNYNPQSIISYCDLSKFDGDIYNKLGFILNSKSIKPSKHWYNIKTKQHITDNLLRQRGFDQLFGTAYGKGTSNEELMIKAGFLPVYDCGQASYSWLNKTI